MLTVASPNKTWVGILGAVALGTGTAVALGALAPHVRWSSAPSMFSRHPGDDGDQPEHGAFSLASMAPVQLGFAGAGLCLVGILGDLWESLLKRAASVKVRLCMFMWWSVRISLLRGSLQLRDSCVESREDSA